MIIKKVKLNNIRSYLEEEINFPNGSTLLAGNVGSGKSSILLAIDFALFGLQKGNITGSSLLRSDSNKGSVELEFELDDKKITVKRGLKKEGDKIVQDSGSLIVNDEKQSLTAVELKERILKLLNYPKELLTKSKSLIYRYTVYTPQEEMKEILNSDKEVRLDVLRKIFGIDKYKRIKENSEIFISNLKERRRESQGAISDLSDKENMKNKYNEDIKKIDNEIKSTKPKLDNVSKNIEDKKSKLRELENNIKKISEIKQEFRVNEIKLKNKEEIKNKNLKDVLLLKQNISDFKEEKTEIVDIHNELLNKEVLCKKIENDIRNLTIKTSEVKTNKRNSVILKENISKLSICPTCKQHVRNEYKSIINNDENGKIRKYELELLDLEQKMSSLDTDFINVRKDMDFFKNKEQEYNLYKMKLENFNEKNKKIELLNKELENIDEEILKLNKLNKDLTEKINEFKDIEIEYEIVKKEIDDKLAEQRKLELQNNSFEKETEGLKNNLINLEKEIKVKLEIKEKLNKYIELQNWFENEFSNLIENMERQIMSKIYHDFNSLFQKWFSMIIDNELLAIKIDNEFSPLIQQNNYDMDYEYLSGGERTSIALAYRLALNQVINNLITNIKTKDLLILDEPTDGFSSEQLDKIRYVLDDLNVKQIIIVSHDPKIETFVDNIIRLNKKEHVSNII